MAQTSPNYNAGMAALSHLSTALLARRAQAFVEAVRAVNQSRQLPELTALCEAWKDLPVTVAAEISLLAPTSVDDLAA